MSYRPTTDDKYVGIEIECFADEDEFFVESVLRKYKLRNNINIASDGSIESEHLYNECRQDEDSYDLEVYRRGYEFQVLAKQSELKDILNRTGLALKEIHADVNDSCGLHVHLDMRNRKVIDSVKKLLNVQPLMLKSVPKSRRNNSYCRPVTKELINSEYKIGKYHVINTESLDDKNTIEVRVHEGTVDTNEIYKWCKFLIQTVDGNFAAKTTRTTAKLPIRLKKYINERMRKC